MKDLTNLRKIAQNEPSHRWGQWTADEDDWEGFVVFANDGLPGQSVVANGIRQGHDEGKATATHIATFDPPTVLALITRLEQAEQAVARVREQRDKWEREGSAYWISAEAAVIALDYALRALDGDTRG